MAKHRGTDRKPRLDLELDEKACDNYHFLKHQLGVATAKAVIKDALAQAAAEHIAAVKAQSAKELEQMRAAMEAEMECNCEGCRRAFGLEG